MAELIEARVDYHRDLANRWERLARLFAPERDSPASESRPHREVADHAAEGPDGRARQ